MDTLVFFFAALALGSANPIGPTITYSGPSLDELVRSAINSNVHWLLSGIRDGSFEGPDLPRAVVALFLAEPGFFSPGHEIGQDLRDKISTALTELIRQAPIPQGAAWTDRFRMTQRNGSSPSNLPSEELALYVQALLVSCRDPSSFFGGYDLTAQLWDSVLRPPCEQRVCQFPSSAMLALCNARATSLEDVSGFTVGAINFNSGYSSSIDLTDEEAFLPMTFECLETQYPYSRVILKGISIQHLPILDPIRRSGYHHYPSNLTVEDFQELITLDDDPLGNTTSVSTIAAVMQTLMYNHRLQVSDLPRAVDFLLKRQEEDGSWGQSTLNSFLVLPVLSNKSFLDITSDHCPEKSENESVAESGKVVINVQYNTRLILLFPPFDTLYNALTRCTDLCEYHVNYQNGTNGQPYLYSLGNKKINPETGFFWFTYEHSKWPKESWTLLTQSHADIKLKPNHKYWLLYAQRSEEEAPNDQI